MKNVNEMSDAEIKAAAEKYQQQLEKRKAYQKTREKKPLTDEQKAKRLEYGRQKRATEKAILEVAKEKGLLGQPADTTPRIAKDDKKKGGGKNADKQ